MGAVPGLRGPGPAPRGFCWGVQGVSSVSRPWVLSWSFRGRGWLVLSAGGCPSSHFSGFGFCFAFFSSQNPGAAQLRASPWSLRWNRDLREAKPRALWWQISCGM